MRGRFLPYLRPWREHRALLVMELAAAAQISRQHVWLVELGRQRASFPAIRRIAAALQIRPDELMNQEPPNAARADDRGAA